MDAQDITVGLTAVILAVTQEVPRVLVVRRMRHPLATAAQQVSAGADGDGIDALPFGPFEPGQHRTLELGLRHWVEEQTGLGLHYVEQLYTFGNQYRDLQELRGGPRVVSVAYLALTHETPVAGSGDAHWHDWYSYLPWEDWRDGEPEIMARSIRPALRRWIRQGGGRAGRAEREDRVCLCFGLDGASEYDRTRTLERYELLYEAGLVPEAHRDRVALGDEQGDDPETPAGDTVRSLGPPMALDNRRILASALGRIRGKLAYRPVVFELLPEDFTLLQLQRVAEAIAGTRLHKQNFRRMVAAGDLVEATGRMESAGRGRPAELYRFRRDVILERAAVGVGLPGARAAE